MEQVCYDEMGISMTIAPPAVAEAFERVASNRAEERRRWAFGQAMGFATMKRSEPTLSELESWTGRFLRYTETGSFGDPA